MMRAFFLVQVNISILYSLWFNRNNKVAAAPILGWICAMKQAVHVSSHFLLVFCVKATHMLHTPFNN